MFSIFLKLINILDTTKMNTSQLIVELSQRVNIPKVKTEELLEDVVSVMIQQLNENNMIVIHNFGTLELKKKGERVNVHPVTGKRTLIPPKLTVSYRPSLSLKGKIKEVK